jgi:hypothetical protein
MHRALCVSLAFALAFVAGCHATEGAAPAGSKHGTAATQLEKLVLLNGSSTDGGGEFFGTEPDASGTRTSFDAVNCPDLRHGMSCDRRSFTLEGKPAHPKPTEIVILASDTTGQSSKVVRATPGRFIANVDAAIGDGGSLTVTAYQDDGSQATISPK